MNSLMTQGNLKQEDLTSKLVCFGANGFSIFQGLKLGLTIQIQRQYAPFVVNVHCMAHWTNLVVKTLSNLLLVSHIENLLHCLYGYFNHSPKRHFKFTKLTKIMETKSKKIMQNIKTKWISMINPIKRILSEYRILLMKMTLDAPIVPFAKSKWYVIS